MPNAKEESLTGRYIYNDIYSSALNDIATKVM
jgi:hypothetical protein